jgi:hypothetical protein
MIKRIVLQHQSGLMQILGVGPAEGQPREMEATLISGKLTEVNLVAAKRTYGLYRPVMMPEKRKTFNKEQR